MIEENINEHIQEEPTPELGGADRDLELFLKIIAFIPLLLLLH